LDDAWQGLLESPHIAVRHPLCRRCGKFMRLARIEAHPRSSKSESCFYDCGCGSVESTIVDHSE
jgi:hypothetical protein